MRRRHPLGREEQGRSLAQSKARDETLGREGRRVGLARALSKLGFCSRSKATELIHAGRVTLNGALRRDPEDPVNLGRDQIRVDGRVVEAASRSYVVVNKPRGLVTTTSDEHGRETIYDSLRLPGGEDGNWLAPVGRLDKASEGLLLLTNDSEWAAKVIAPETHLEKTYHVQVACVASEPLLASLRRGVWDKGEFLSTRSVCTLRRGERNSWLEVVLDEGKNRHIRRMIERLGIEVLRLVRVAIGPLKLGDLRKGESRLLSREEKEALDRTMGLGHDATWITRK